MRGRSAHRLIAKQIEPSTVICEPFKTATVHIIHCDNNLQYPYYYNVGGCDPAENWPQSPEASNVENPNNNLFVNGMPRGYLYGRTSPENSAKAKHVRGIYFKKEDLKRWGFRRTSPTFNPPTQYAWVPPEIVNALDPPTYVTGPGISASHAYYPVKRRTANDPPYKGYLGWCFTDQQGYDLSDNTGPTAPSVTSVTVDTGYDNEDKITSDNTLTIQGTASPGHQVLVYDTISGARQLVGFNIVNGMGNFSVTTDPLYNGTHRLQVQTMDTLKNESAAVQIGTWLVDNSPPVEPIINKVTVDTNIDNDKVTSANTLTVFGLGEPGCFVKIYDSAVLIGQGSIDSDSKIEVTTNELEDGQHVLSIILEDKAGNTSPTKSLGTWTIDTQTPDAPVVTSVSTDTGLIDNNTKDTTLTVIGTAEPGSVIKLFANNVMAGLAVTNSGGNFSVTTIILRDGAYALKVNATDTAGLISAYTAIGTWEVDTSPPDPPVVSTIEEDTGTPGDKITSDKSLTISGTAENGATIKVYSDGVLVGTNTADGFGNYYVVTSELSVGSHVLKVTATDIAGNESSPVDLGAWSIIESFTFFAKSDDNKIICPKDVLGFSYPAKHIWHNKEIKQPFLSYEWWEDNGTIPARTVDDTCKGLIPFCTPMPAYDHEGNLLGHYVGYSHIVFFNNNFYVAGNNQGKKTAEKPGNLPIDPTSTSQNPPPVRRYKDAHCIDIHVYMVANPLSGKTLKSPRIGSRRLWTVNNVIGYPWNPSGTGLCIPQYIHWLCGDIEGEWGIRIRLNVLEGGNQEVVMGIGSLISYLVA